MTEKSQSGGSARNGVPVKGAVTMAGNPHVVADQSEVLAFLSRPATYGISEVPIRIDTHAAIIFLAGPYAYKMKRAVRFSFLDFSTVERRRQGCQAELELNRKTAPELYLDVVPVTQRNGALRLGGDGPAVEWLLRMRRFDPNMTLDRVAGRDALTDAIITDLVAAISDAHAAAEPEDGDAAMVRLGEWMRGNFDELGETPDAIAQDDVSELRRRSEAAFRRLEPLLLARGHVGYVCRCHGDLHLRNIVLIDGRPILFDALEFDDAFATHDIFYDLAFLLMDLWQRGLRSEANHVLNRYLWRSGDVADIDGCALLPLFMSIRAAIRAKVSISTASFEDPVRARVHVEEARHYFEFSQQFLEPATPLLIAIGGLSGTGKTSLSGSIAPQIGRPPGAIHLRSDIERKRLFGVADTDRLAPPTYTQAANVSVYERLCDKAGHALKAGQSVIVDAVHNRPAEREAIEAIARAHGSPFLGIWLEAPDEVLLARVAARTGDASDADTTVVRRQLLQASGPIRWQRISASRDRERIHRDVLSILQTAAK